MSGDQSPRTLAQKVWDAHVVRQADGEPDLLYIDLHLLHEVTSPQAFDGLRMAGRPVRRPDLTIATEDHNTPTDNLLTIADPISRTQIETLRKNCADFGIRLHPLGHEQQGIVHVIGPQLGLTQPGMTIVCGDSHTATHGAFGALAFGIGTSEVEHVLATQTLPQRRPQTLRVRFEGLPGRGVVAKDLILGLIGQEGMAGMTGHVAEYTGEVIRSLSMECRMTVCNMSIEGGARAGYVSPDATTFAYLEGRPGVREGDLEHWQRYVSDPGATYDREVVVDVPALAPMVTWGTNPGQAVPVTARVPDPTTADEERALHYMALEAGTAMEDVAIDRVFIGSCTNGRLEDLRAAARVVEGKRVSGSVSAMVVPGSMAVKVAAEREGLDRVFTAAGFEWRSAGCSMCLGMNPDILQPGERCASTSNRNFEGRQGRGGRTHLVSPEMAAAAAVAGHLVDVRSWD